MKRLVFSESRPLQKVDSLNYIFDSSVASKELRSRYLQRIGFEECHFIARNELIFYRKSIGFWVRVLALFQGLKWSVECIFSAQRVNKALLYRSLVEFICLVKSIDGETDSKVFDFNQFEVDSNLFYVAAKKLYGSKLVYYKFPSPGPLTLHNSILLTDILCYNTPYHFDEIEFLGDDIQYDELIRVPVEQYFTYESIYKDIPVHDFKIDLAYYSHASWLRKSSGHADDGLNIIKFERKLLKCLKRLLESDKSIRLKIYTHPREREPSVVEKTIEFYSEFFEADHIVSFSELGTRSSHEFADVKVGVGVYSTILFERLSCGFPTLIMTPTSTFPLSSSRLSNVVIDETNAHEKIKGALKLSVQEFFDQHEINDYVEPLLINDH